jgi:hypothetical protein
VCAIPGGTISSRTYGGNEQSQGHVALTWGTAQQQSPPTATYMVADVRSSTTVQNGKLVVDSENVQRQVPQPVEAHPTAEGFALLQHVRG